MTIESPVHIGMLNTRDKHAWNNLLCIGWIKSDFMVIFLVQAGLLMGAWLFLTRIFSILQEEVLFDLGTSGLCIIHHNSQTGLFW